MRLKLFFAAGALLWSQKIVSRNYIDVEGYSVETSLDLQRTPLLPDKRGNFAYVERFTTSKYRPKPDLYLQLLRLDYTELWATPLEVNGTPPVEFLDAYTTPEGFLILGRQEDPIHKTYQLVGKLVSFRGQAAPKWNYLSNWDQPYKESQEFRCLSPDSNLFLWIGITSTNAYLTLHAPDGRRFLSLRTWDIPLRKTHELIDLRCDLRGNPVLLLQKKPSAPDTAAPLWLLHYDYKSKNYRLWALRGDSNTVYFPGLYVDEKYAYVGAVGPGKDSWVIHTKGMPPQKWGTVYLWQIGLRDSTYLSHQIPLPTEWIKHYSSRTPLFTQSRWICDKNQLFWLWEEVFTDKGIKTSYGAYDVIILSWEKTQDSLHFAFAHRLEKRQKDYLPQTISYATCLTPQFLHLVYLTDKSAQAKLIAHSINRQTGEAISHTLAQNTESDLYLFPRQSTTVMPGRLMILGPGKPGKNDYSLIYIRLP